MSKQILASAASVALLLGLAFGPNAHAEQSDSKQTTTSVRIGTFDSRAVAMAYYRSEPFQQQVKELHAEHERAKAAGDQKRAKELEHQGPALQEQLHKQGFGTWPVDNILNKIKAPIPEIARQAGVDVIVSKWDLVYQRPGIKTVDVTDQLVKPFQPNEETRKVIADIQKQDPIPLDQLEGHVD